MGQSPRGDRSQMSPDQLASDDWIAEMGWRGGVSCCQRHVRGGVMNADNRDYVAMRHGNEGEPDE